MPSFPRGHLLIYLPPSPVFRNSLSRPPLPLKTHVKSEFHVSCKMRDPGRIEFWLVCPRPALDCREARRVPEFNHVVHNRRLALHLVCIWTRQRFWTPDKSQPIIDTIDWIRAKARSSPVVLV